MIEMTVLHHADADGFGAAYAHWTTQQPAHYIPVQYGQAVPEIPEGTKFLYILDFSYDRATLAKLHGKYIVVVIDHHKTAQATLDGLPGAVFDMKKSGAVLAWEFFCAHDPVPEILKYVQDRDLWKFELPTSEEVNLYIASLPWDFEIWADFDLATAVSAGTAIKSFRDQQIESALRSVRMLELVCDAGAFEVPVVNATANISELGNELCKQYPDKPFSASYCDREDVRTWSLRSIGAFDVSAVAKSCGGGGHRNAAGFTTEIGWPGYISTDFREGFEEGSLS